MENLVWWFRELCARTGQAWARLRDEGAALRYAHPVAVWLAPLVLLACGSAAAAGVVAWRGHTHAPVPRPVVMPALRVAVHGSNDPVTNARLCQAAAAGLTGAAAAHPRYAQMDRATRTRVELWLSTVGQICDPVTAQRSATQLRPWLAGTAPTRATPGAARRR